MDPDSTSATAETAEKPPRVVAWIVNYESSSYLRKCLESIRGVDEVLVLDNGSSPEEWQRVEAIVADEPRARALRSDTNLGFGGGHNLISRHCSSTAGDIVWLLNPDSWLATGTLSGLLSPLRAGTVDIISPLILTTRNGVDRIWFSGGDIDRQRGVIQDSQLGRDPSAITTVQSLLTTRFMTGAAPAMTRKSWDRLGGFDDALFLYWEDVDLSLRATALEMRMAVCPEVLLRHAEGGSSKTNKTSRARSYYLMSRNRILVCRRPRTRGLSLVIGPGTSSLLRLLAYAVAREGSGRVARSVAILRGAFDALATRPAASPTGGDLTSVR